MGGGGWWERNWDKRQNNLNIVRGWRWSERGSSVILLSKVAIERSIFLISNHCLIFCCLYLIPSLSLPPHPSPSICIGYHHQQFLILRLHPTKDIFSCTLVSHLHGNSMPFWPSIFLTLVRWHTPTKIACWWGYSLFLLSYGFDCLSTLSFFFDSLIVGIKTFFMFPWL